MCDLTRLVASLPGTGDVVVPARFPCLLQGLLVWGQVVEATMGTPAAAALASVRASVLGKKYMGQAKKIATRRAGQPRVAGARNAPLAKPASSMLRDTCTLLQVPPCFVASLQRAEVRGATGGGVAPAFLLSPCSPWQHRTWVIAPPLTPHPPFRGSWVLYSPASRRCSTRTCCC